ncbi:hypothetical protein BDV96DRAFT_639178 [Lophiotrema nucula]|uniref:DUF6590 domain-containing protein n=1 Tax=Lophiotrema nucula TaxID=690887 RepID=A0A6A5ZSX5_9PLEO|nr:hypothetical protein BDV96DRAFT_639178 [Lophiotrema nucula]
MSLHTREWTWSEPHRKYYYHEWNVLKKDYDLIWASTQDEASQRTEPSALPAVPPIHSSSYGTIPYADGVPRDGSHNWSPALNPSSPTTTMSLQDDHAVDDSASESEDAIPTNQKFRRVAFTHVERYFRIGRIFEVLASDRLQTNNRGIPVAKVKRYVVIRPKTTHSLCLPIHTYGGRGTAYPKLKADYHAPLIRQGNVVQIAPSEQLLAKDPLEAIVEDIALTLSPLSRIDFSKVFTVEAVTKIRPIGMVSPGSLHLLNEYFEEVMARCDEEECVEDEE